MISPKEQFRGNADEAGKFGTMMDEPLIRKAITYAMAQYSQGSPSSEAMQGANQFVSILVSLHEEQKAVQFPQRTLTTI
jgi:hypothetical protein